MGYFDKAVIFYETSLVNSKFEKEKPFRLFLKNLQENMLTCYEKKLGELDAQTLGVFLGQDSEIDISFQFPFSLSQNVIIPARLYELSPEQYPQFAAFYQSAKNKDSELRRADKRSDETTMKTMSIYIWGILLALWAIYGLVVGQTLVHKK